MKPKIKRRMIAYPEGELEGLNPMKKSKHDQICKKCGLIIKGATREGGGVSSVYVHHPVKNRGWYHFNCRYNVKKKV